MTTTHPNEIQPLTGAEGLRVLVNSWPKAGTHLLLELVRHVLGDGRWLRDRDVKAPGDESGFLPGIDARIAAHREGFAMKGHFPWSAPIQNGLDERGVRVLLIVRDLRDVACSTLRWLRDLSPDWPASQRLLALPTDEQRLACVLGGLSDEHPFDRDSGIDWTAPLPGRYSRLTDWADHLQPGAVVRYEDLIGANGEESQHRVIRGVIGVLGLDADPDAVRCLAGAVYNPDAVTFHTGSSGGWAGEFTPAHRRLFVDSGGDAVNTRFGYAPTPIPS